MKITQKIFFLDISYFDYFGISRFWNFYILNSTYFYIFFAFDSSFFLPLSFLIRFASSVFFSYENFKVQDKYGKLVERKNIWCSISPHLWKCIYDWVFFCFFLFEESYLGVQFKQTKKRKREGDKMLFTLRHRCELIWKRKRKIELRTHVASKNCIYHFLFGLAHFRSFPCCSCSIIFPWRYHC